MSVFPITFIVSACLLAIFILYFARTHSGQRKRGVDQESLLPLEEETPKVVLSASQRAQAEREAQENSDMGNGAAPSAKADRTKTGTTDLAKPDAKIVESVKQAPPEAEGKGRSPIEGEG